MANATAAEVAAFMALPDFDANTIPTSTEVGAMIDLADASVNNVEVSMTSEEKKLLSICLTASFVARAPGLFGMPDSIDLAKSYREDYSFHLKQVRNKAQYTLPNTDFAYGKIRKVNR